MLGQLFLDQRRRLADVAADGIGQPQMAQRQGRVGTELALVQADQVERPAAQVAKQPISLGHTDQKTERRQPCFFRS